MNAVRKIRKFNPGTLQPDAEVREQFVVRQRELDSVLEVLRGNIDVPSCQHVLVVAPRGRGKTMLLARVAAELRANPELSGGLLPVRFMEESQEIFTLADFWLETLFHLARESEAHNPAFAQELRETHAALTGRWREQTLEEQARAAVLEATNRLGKKLVLMVENLQALCENVDAAFGWKLRGVLQSEPQIMLVATATSRFKGLDDAQQPFFELFRIVGLEPLSTEECRDLWQVISGDTVSKREMRPLEILSGGSPRLLVIVAGFGQHRSLLQLMEELVTLIDEHTEYFRSNMEVLAKTERRVYIAVIDLWQPSTTGEIAARARMDVRAVSALLGRLVNRGAVIPKGSGKKRQYVAAERLYSIYYKLRREHDEAAVVQNLIHFMVAFYSESELAEMSGAFVAEAAQSRAIREGIERAVAELPELDRIFSDIRRPVMEGSQPGKVELSGSLTVTDNEAAERLLQEISTAFKEGAFEKVVETVDQVFTARSANLPRVPESLIARALLVKAMAYKELDDSQAAIAAYDEIVTRFGASDSPEVQEGAAWALSGKGDVERERGELGAAIAAYDEVVTRFGTSDNPQLRGRVAWALNGKGDVERERGELGAAIAAYDEIVTRFGTSDNPQLQEGVAWALNGKGDAERERGELGAAIAAYDEVVTRFGTSDNPQLQVPVAWALYDKGNVERERGELGAAIAAYDEVVTRFGTSDSPQLRGRVAWALSRKGSAERERGERAAAIAAYDEVVTRFGTSDNPQLQVPVAWALNDKGNAERERGELGAAIAAYDEVVTRFGTSDNPQLQVPVAWALSRKGSAERERAERAAAIAAYDEVVTRFGTSDNPQLRGRVAWALSRKGDVQTERGHTEEALHTCEELERKLDSLPDGEKTVFEWQVRCLRTKALLVQEDSRAAMEAFRSAYDVFVPDNTMMMSEMLHFVPDLIATGASAPDLVEILSSDKAKSDKLRPLIVALREYHTGEAARAPEEVREVAADIIERIEQRIEARASKEGSAAS